MSPTTQSMTKTTTCSPCAAGAHLLCTRKSDDRNCTCATCYPSPAIERTIKGLFIDLAISTYRSVLVGDQIAQVEAQVLRAVRHQLAGEPIEQWVLAVPITNEIMSYRHREYWSMEEFERDLASIGVDAEILNSPYVLGE